MNDKKSLGTREVELSAVIDEKQRRNIKKYLDANLKRIGFHKRFMMRFHKSLTVNIRDPLDIRYKWTNGKHELVIKQGVIGSQIRQELIIPLVKNTLSQLVILFQLLGYGIGNAMYRETEKYTGYGVEVSLVTVGKYICIEVEAIDAKSEEQAFAVINDFFKKINLRPLEVSEYQSFISIVDRDINFQFPLSQFPKPLLESNEWKNVLEKTVFKK